MNSGALAVAVPQDQDTQNCHNRLIFDIKFVYSATWDELDQTAKPWMMFDGNIAYTKESCC